MNKCMIEKCQSPADFHLAYISERRLAQFENYCLMHGVETLHAHNARTQDSPGVGKAAQFPDTICFDLEYVNYVDTGSKSWFSLREVDGVRRIAFHSGYFEAAAFVHRLEHGKYIRPCTHDAFIMTVASMDGAISCVVVDELICGNATYRASLHIRQGGTTRIVDARPSDAIALAVFSGAPIFIHHRVIATLATRHDSTYGES